VWGSTRRGRTPALAIGDYGNGQSIGLRSAGGSLADLGYRFFGFFHSRADAWRDQSAQSFRLEAKKRSILVVNDYLEGCTGFQLIIQFMDKLPASGTSAYPRCYPTREHYAFKVIHR
jgi:hypothetical protein